MSQPPLVRPAHADLLEWAATFDPDPQVRADAAVVRSGLRVWR